MSNIPRGFSLQFNGGSYGGFYVTASREVCGVCLGWFAIRLFFYDVEPVIHNAIRTAWPKAGPATPTKERGE